MLFDNFGFAETETSTQLLGSVPEVISLSPFKSPYLPTYTPFSITAQAIEFKATSTAGTAIQFQILKFIGVGTGVAPAPSTDPDVRSYRIRLLRQVVTAKRTLG